MLNIIVFIPTDFPDPVVPVRTADSVDSGHLYLLHAPDAGGITRCHGVWKIAGEIIN